MILSYCTHSLRDCNGHRLAPNRTIGMYMMGNQTKKCIIEMNLSTSITNSEEPIRVHFNINEVNIFSHNSL